ncbi:MAG: histidine kinase, partial [Candidatus Hydrogenedentes bacterium]|nr:histidine kinase [Candidatus Hydrogenedentota bacterium]
RIVFIGPCIAKKAEILSPNLRHEVDGALTFRELRRMFQEREITLANTTPAPLDPPFGRAGGLYPISRGLLQAANITEDFTRGEVVAADGKSQYPDAIEEFQAGRLDVRLLEVLACRGCINGPGISYGTSVFTRQMAVSRHVRQRLGEVDEEEWRATMDRFASLDLSRSYESDDQRWDVPTDEELRLLLRKIGKNDARDELNCGACGYDTCRELAIATYKGLAESAMCLPWTIEQLRKTMRDLAVSNDKLDETREALLHSERLASMGQLAAGIAHELNNPLGVILMYAHLLQDEYDCSGQLHDDLAMITEQSDRCKKIVAGLLDFARQNKVECEETDIVQLIDRALTAVPAPVGVEVEVRHDSTSRTAMIDRDQMLQVLINLLSNAYAAMPSGGRVTIVSAIGTDRMRLSISDTGTGIPLHARDKIFEPFFTTRQSGQGTGLGLAVSYGIVKMHRGDIAVTSNTDPAAGATGTTFTITLPQTADCS